MNHVCDLMVMVVIVCYHRTVRVNCLRVQVVSKDQAQAVQVCGQDPLWVGSGPV